MFHSIGKACTAWAKCAGSTCRAILRKELGSCGMSSLAVKSIAMRMLAAVSPAVLDRCLRLPSRSGADSVSDT